MWAQVAHTNARNSWLHGSRLDEIACTRGSAWSLGSEAASRPGLFVFQNFASLASRRFPPPRSEDVVWLKGNAHEKFAPSHSQGRISRISAIEP
jgi:hypothetical protein